MELPTRPPAMQLPVEWFTGDAYADVIRRGEEPFRMRAGIVRFTPGARTAWHSHALGQTLHIVEGIALVRSTGTCRAQPVHEPPRPVGDGRRHWLEHVPDDDYKGPRVSVSTRTRP